MSSVQEGKSIFAHGQCGAASECGFQLQTGEENKRKKTGSDFVQSIAGLRPDATRAQELASGALDFVLDVPLMSNSQLFSESLARQSYVCVVFDFHGVYQIAEV